MAQGAEPMGRARGGIRSGRGVCVAACVCACACIVVIVVAIVIVVIVVAIYTKRGIYN